MTHTVKNLAAMQETWVRSLNWEDALPTPVFLPGEFQGQRSLVGYSPWGCKESDTTEQPAVSLFSGVGVVGRAEGERVE